VFGVEGVQTARGKRFEHGEQGKSGARDEERRLRSNSAVYTVVISIGLRWSKRINTGTAHV